ncbi:hypothetical protein [Hydrogenophaga sp. OTU3427]
MSPSTPSPTDYFASTRHQANRLRRAAIDQAWDALGRLLRRALRRMA